MNLTSLISTMPGITSGTTNSTVHSWLIEDIVVQDRASANSLRAWAAGGGRRARFKRLSEPSTDGSTDGVSSLAQTAVDILLGSEGLDTNDPRLPALLDAMEANELLTGTDRSELMSTGQRTFPRWRLAEDCSSAPTLTDVINARAQ